MAYTMTVLSLKYYDKIDSSHFRGLLISGDQGPMLCHSLSHVTHTLSFGVFKQHIFISASDVDAESFAPLVCYSAGHRAY